MIEEVKTNEEAAKLVDGVLSQNYNITEEEMRDYVAKGEEEHWEVYEVYEPASEADRLVDSQFKMEMGLRWQELQKQAIKEGWTQNELECCIVQEDDERVGTPEEKTEPSVYIECKEHRDGWGRFGDLWLGIDHIDPDTAEEWMRRTMAIAASLVRLSKPDTEEERAKLITELEQETNDDVARQWEHNYKLDIDIAELCRDVEWSFSSLGCHSKKNDIIINRNLFPI